jgi:hypothetical protein
MAKVAMIPANSQYIIILLLEDHELKDVSLLLYKRATTTDDWKIYNKQR